MKHAFAPPTLAASPLASSQALASVATLAHAPHMLRRGGPHQRSVNLVARGADITTASVIAAAQGKGHVGELAQSAHFTTAAVALGRPNRARPNPIANDPRIDVEVLNGGKRRFGAQVKVGTPAYIEKSIRGGKYDHLIANVEALDELGIADVVPDRLDFDRVTAPQLSAAECESTAIDALERMLLDTDAVATLDVLTQSARAGAHQGLASFAMSLVGQFAHSMLHGIELDVRAAVEASLAGAARAAARTSIETALLIRRFLEEASTAFSSRLLARITRSRIAVSAIAEVILETSVDVVDVLRGRMSFEDLLRRFGVHVMTATGGALGFAAGLALTANAHPLVSILVACGFAYAGSQAGRALGEQAFLRTTHGLLLLA